ncbi:hypothetical protein NDU88_000689 [Pleurodeles waltl]|uniref:Uncharacterized protein n=1 Tax=Pleurodeles waltl TaxID=8319 RepID=A0AAV7VZ89_PLEWA|nr:hypothetical protein NDU88_000689 [Pleurodeles waltl]
MLNQDHRPLLRCSTHRGLRRPALVLLVQKQEDYRRKNMEFRLHGVVVPRGVCRGERFPFKIPVSAVFLSAVNPPRKRWRIGLS